MTAPPDALDLPKLLAARHRAARAAPYLSTALFAMAVVSDRSVLTMAVDRYWRCYASPTFVAATPVAELAGVWLHEVAHLLRDHHGRARRLLERSRAAADAGRAPLLDPDQPRRQQLRMNLAMDCEINDDFAATEEVVLPAGAVTPRRLEIQPSALFEQYLEQLPDSALYGRLAWSDCGSGAHDGSAPWDLGPDGAHPLSPSQADAVRYRVAEQIRRSAGRAPRGWRRWAEGVGEPTLDWRRLLHALIRQGLHRATGPADYAYRRPARRAAALAGNVVMPSLIAPQPAVAVVIDTSGSVADSELGAALSETAGIIKAGGTAGRRVTVYSCDAAVQTAEDVCTAEQVTLMGGGGTDLRRGIARALDANPRPDLVVVLTDGHTPWPEEQPGARVVAGLFGPEPELDEEGQWRPRRPPAWVETVRLGGPG